MTTRPALRRALLAATAIGACLGVAAAAGASAGSRVSLTVMQSPSNGSAAVYAVGSGAPPRQLWRCPNDGFCGDLVSAAWAPDGRRIAISLTRSGVTASTRDST